MVPEGLAEAGVGQVAGQDLDPAGGHSAARDSSRSRRRAVASTVMSRSRTSWRTSSRPRPEEAPGDHGDAAAFGCVTIGLSGFQGYRRPRVAILRHHPSFKPARACRTAAEWPATNDRTGRSFLAMNLHRIVRGWTIVVQFSKSCSGLGTGTRSTCRNCVVERG